MGASLRQLNCWEEICKDRDTECDTKVNVRCFHEWDWVRGFCMDRAVLSILTDSEEVGCNQGRKKPATAGGVLCCAIFLFRSVLITENCRYGFRGVMSDHLPSCKGDAIGCGMAGRMGLRLSSSVNSWVCSVEFWACAAVSCVCFSASVACALRIITAWAL